jgi:hypothetical protein
MLAGPRVPDGSKTALVFQDAWNQRTSRTSLLDFGDVSRDPGRIICFGRSVQSADDQLFRLVGKLPDHIHPCTTGLFMARYRRSCFDLGCIPALLAST